MASPFPTLGPPDRLGRRGMFIGEFHDDMRDMQRLLMTWPVLCRQIDVLFLEQFDAGEIPPATSIDAMREAFARYTDVPAAAWARFRREKWSPDGVNYMMPDHTLRLAQMAKRTGTPLRGIDVMKKLDGQSLDEWIATRRGDLMHQTLEQALTANLHQLFGTTAGKRYAIYGGMMHGPLLRRHIPELVLYALDHRLQYHEYDECRVSSDGQMRIVWAR